MSVDFVPAFIRGVRGLRKPRPELAAAYFLSYKRPYYEINLMTLTVSSELFQTPGNYGRVECLHAH